jgi:flagellar protein FlaI
LVPRPDPSEELHTVTEEILENAEPLLDRYRDIGPSNVASALAGMATEPEEAGEKEEIDFGQFVPKAGTEADEE